MMGVRAISSGRKDEFLIPLVSIQVKEGENIRVEYGDIAQLANDLATNGQKLPIIVRVEDDIAYVSDGFRRHRAFIWAEDHLGVKDTEVRCIIEAKVESEEQRILNQLSYNNNKPFTAVEMGIAFTRLSQTMKVAQIAKACHRPQQYVKDCLELAKAPDTIQNLVSEGKMAPTTAKKMMKAPKEEQEKAVEKASKGEKIKSKDFDHAKEFSADDFLVGLKKGFGFISASEAEERHCLTTVNLTIRIDQKDPPLAAIMVLPTEQGTKEE